MDRFT